MLNFRKAILTVMMSCLVGIVFSQNLLEKRISLDVNRQRLDDVLSIISDKGGFTFSYNSQIVKRDSLVSLSVTNRSVRQILALLLSDQYEYKESGNYIILRRVALRLTTVTDKSPVTDNIYTISGYVVNSETGDRLTNVSVYETEHLVSALTDEHGRFELKLKSKYPTASLSVSKYSYEDTTVVIEPKFNMQLVIAIVPVADTVFVSVPNVYEVVDSSIVRLKDSAVVPVPMEKTEIEQTAVAKFLLTARQKVQSLNIKRFIAERPFQASLIPGITTQGTMSGQMIHNVSFNLFGGYTGEINGLEIGGLFNLNRKDVKYVQIAGLFNVTGGSVTGFQAAGVSNAVLGDLQGFQVSSVANYVKKNVRGFQVAGISNMSGGIMSGLQVASIFNYAKKQQGVQIGLINISDTSDGYSIGLINIVMRGYHKLAISRDEVINTNIAFKTGSRRFYSILQGGMNLGSKEDDKAYSFGYGLGTEKRITNWITLNPELTCQYLYLGSWDYTNLLSKLHLNLNIQPFKGFRIFGGPSIAAYYTDQDVVVKGYRSRALPGSYHSFKTGLDKTRGWFGWNIGIALF
ncbi:MAG: STN and carboxypeptidase regulatory-like domain-containing protein [Chitinophagaceae bacterium]